MNICSKKHQEIVYEYGDCPFCNELIELNRTIAQLKEHIAHLERVLSDGGEK